MSDFRPVESHFHKPRGDPAHVKAIKITPRAKPLVKNYDALEYVAKHMFVGKAMPWPKAVSYVLSLSLSLFPLPHDSQTLKVLESSLRNEKLIPSPIHRAITPGTSNLVPLLVKQGLTDQSKPVNKLSLQEWTKIADTFEDWPFRPAVRRYPFSTRLLLSELTNGKVDSIYRT